MLKALAALGFLFSAVHAHATTTDFRDRRFLAGAMAGSPSGVGAYGMYALNESWSAGVFSSAAHAPSALLLHVAGRIRYHFWKASPKGLYIFSDLSYIRASLKDLDPGAPVLELKDEAVVPTFGIGYQTVRRLSFDIGLGIGPRTVFRRRTEGTLIQVTLQNTGYLGLAYSF